MHSLRSHTYQAEKRKNGRACRPFFHIAFYSVFRGQNSARLLFRGCLILLDHQLDGLDAHLDGGLGVVALGLIQAGENGSGLSSMLSQISQLMVDLVGTAFPYMSPVIGIFGAFVSGSCTVSSTLFGPLQYETAELLGLSTTTIVALQLTGGALGNMICINNVVAVTSTTNAPGHEGRIIRTNLLPCLVYCAIVWVTYLAMGI